MKKLLPTLSFVMIGALFLFSAKQERTALYQCVDKNDATQTRASGGIGGYTGSPGDGFDCTDCHDNPIDFSLVASITTNIPASGYVPGQSYTIQVGGTSDGSEFGRGFELTAENASNVAVGSYDLTGATGNPQEITMRSLAAEVARLAGVEPTFDYQPRPQDDPSRRCPDITIARRLLGWEPVVDLADGLEMTLDWFASQIGVDLQPALRAS